MVFTRPRRADVRDAVLDAATELFVRHGYAATTLADVAAAAGYTKGAVYSNFGGKPELFAAAMQVYFAEAVVGAVGEALGAAAGTTEVTPARAMARALADDALLGERWPALLGEFRAVVSAQPELRPLYTQLRVAQRAQLVDALRRAGEQVPLRADLDLEAAATLLLTCVLGLSVERVAAPDALPTSLVEGLFAHVLDGLLA